MVKVNKKLIILLALIVLIIGIIPNIAFADEFDPDFYKPEGELEGGTFAERAGKVIGIIQFFGIVAAVAVLAILGIKFMLGSVEEKAEYKKAMIPYLVGCAMLILVPTLVRFAANVMKDDEAGTNHEVTANVADSLTAGDFQIQYQCGNRDCHATIKFETDNNKATCRRCGDINVKPNCGFARKSSTPSVGDFKTVYQCCNAECNNTINFESGIKTTCRRCNYINIKPIN